MIFIAPRELAGARDAGNCILQLRDRLPICELTPEQHASLAQLENLAR
jgi:hypothetical protein